MKVKIWNILLKVAGIWEIIMGVYHIAIQYVPDPTCAGMDLICLGIMFLVVRMSETKGGE